MGEKETMADSAARSGTLNVSASPGGSVSAAQGDQDGEGSSDSSEKSVQWEPHKAPGTAEATTVKGSKSNSDN